MAFGIDPSLLDTVGYYLVVLLFLGTVLINSTTQVKQHRDRMIVLGVPFAGVVLWIGFVMQYIGTTLLLFRVHVEIGAAILIVFTVLATLIFHQFWRDENPLDRHLHRSAWFLNGGIVGALLMIIARDGAR